MKYNSSNPVILFILALIMAFFFTACSNKTGCPVNEDAHVKVSKDGNYKSGKAHSGLFPDKVKKRKKKDRKDKDRR